MRLMKSMIFTALLVLTLTSVDATAQTPGAPPFVCKVTAGQASLNLKPVSASETYMQTATLSGFEISTYQNEDGISYNVTVSRAKTVLAQADIVMYDDTSLKLNTGTQLLTVHCMTAPAQTAGAAKP